MAADPIDFCTVADVKLARGNITGANLDERIQLFITGVSSQIMVWSGRRIRPLDAEDAETVRLYDAGAWWPEERRLRIDDLSETPTAVEILDSTGALQTTLDVDEDLELLPLNRDAVWPIEELRFRPAATIPIAHQVVRVTGRFGWPEPLAPLVRQAAIAETIEWLKDSQALTAQSPDQFEPGAPPQRALTLRTRTALNQIRRPGIA